MIWAVFALVALLVLAFDVLAFMATPFDERPLAWWRYAPLSGFFMYAGYLMRRFSTTRTKE